MASLAFPSFRSIFPLFRPPSRISWSPFFSLSNLYIQPRPSLIIPALLGSLLELFPPFLLAVPKKKVSHSRKSMRSANKGLKDKTNIVSCPACGTPKLAHNICPACYSILSRRRKEAQSPLSRTTHENEL